MAPGDPLPPGAPTSAPNDIGAKVLNALEGFVRQGEDLRRDVTRLSSEVTELRIKSGEHGAKLANVEKLLETNSGKLDTLIEKASDMKSNITSLGVKSNINILSIIGGIVAIIAMFNSMMSAINTSRSAGSAPSAVTSPAPKSPGSTP